MKFQLSELRQRTAVEDEFSHLNIDQVRKHPLIVETVQTIPCRQAECQGQDGGTCSDYKGSRYDNWTYYHSRRAMDALQIIREERLHPNTNNQAAIAHLVRMAKEVVGCPA